ncbi:MAG TPA: Asp-tRNA(Asn)/Glu-tRNA(Gln) amidotransferase subunit GatC [Candidatus Acidoferrales bacterium]|jgi:aspartyl-tRNA(Asn)/glutamyl-tRNA(Gln) amidotransferase subunit C|nr:Asp-tRNA(Asn)/Glu-tRNA(Gln) amidotransferase subunit GatC [Candidatus Acidoferrales bacterium]
MKITREEVLRVAELAHLELSEAEVAKYQQQLDSILEYIAKLNAVDTSNVDPMAQVLAETKTVNPAMRDDVVTPCDIAKDVLKQAPDADGAYFRVPKVIER